MRALIALLLLAAAPAQAPLPRGDDLLEEINAVRIDPAGYADHLRTQRAWYRGTILSEPGIVRLQTVEGVSALDQAIAALDRQRPLPPLAWSNVMARAAADHATSQGRAGARGHVGRDGSTPGQRVQRHGGDIYVGESIAYGPFDAEGIVRQLVIDDGVATRGHRKMLLGSEYRHVGGRCATHAAHRAICVLNFAATSDGGPVLPSPPPDR